MGIVGWLAWAVPAARAQAPSERPLVTLDAMRIEPSPFRERALVQLLVRAVDATGNPRAMATKQGGRGWRIAVGKRVLDEPIAVTRASVASVETALAIVVAATPDFRNVLPAITQALDESLLPALRRDDHVAVLSYASTLGGSSRLVGIDQARTSLLALTYDEDAAAPAFTDAVERAITAVERYRPSHPAALVRRVVIVISDGLDGTLDRERITALGLRAAHKGVRIFAIAYAPNGNKESLLNLGELTKHSLGSFRWVRTDAAQAFREQLARLATELTDAYVLTSFIVPPAAAATVRAVGLAGEAEVTSNELPWRAPACGARCAFVEGACRDDVCRSLPRATRWTLWRWRGAPLLAATAMLLVVGIALVRRARRRRVHAAGATHAGAAPPTQTWICLRGAPQGQAAEVRLGDVIGKHPRCGVVILDPSVSDQHAEVRADRDGHWVIRDLGSTNGTFVGGVRVTQAALRIGSVVGLGATQWRVTSQR